MTDNLFKWQISNCLHRKEIVSRDSLSGEPRLIKVPCGTCPHCRDTYRNEWYTRMQIHSRDYANIYFVTLTYSSPDSAASLGTDFIEQPQPVGKPVIRWIKKGTDYQSALFDMHKSIGSFLVADPKDGKRYPGLVNKRALQLFIKLLRTYSGSKDLTYYACSEYGHINGHMHHHLIVWSQKPLSWHHFSHAWSRVYCTAADGSVIPYRGQKGVKTIRVPFGHIQVDDLVANGTMQNHGVDHAGKFVFSYVCKYLNKTDYNRTMVSRIWHRLPFVADLPHTNFLTNVPYGVCRRDYSRSLKGGKHPCLRYYDGKIYDYKSFIKAFAPSNQCSTRTAIGVRFYLAHREEFRKGVPSLPHGADGKSLIMPAYYLRKSREELLPLRKAYTAKDIRSHSVGNLPEILRILSDLRCVSDSTCSSSDPTVIRSALSSVLSRKSGVVAPAVFDRMLRKECTFYDVVNKVLYTPYIDPDAGLVFKAVKYNRKLPGSKWYTVGTISVDDFSAWYSRIIEDYSDHVSKMRRLTDLNDLAFDEFRSKVSTSFDWRSVGARVVELREQHIHSQQLIYDMNHNYL